MEELFILTFGYSYTVLMPQPLQSVLFQSTDLRSEFKIHAFKIITP